MISVISCPRSVVGPTGIHLSEMGSLSKYHHHHLMMMMMMMTTTMMMMMMMIIIIIILLLLLLLPLLEGKVTVS